MAGRLLNASFVCILGVLAAWLSRRWQVDQILSAVHVDVPTVNDDDFARGARVHFTQRITGKKFNSLTWLPAPNSGQAKHSTLPYSAALIVGDSYADDIDMGFICWPTLVGRNLSLPVLNVAKGGSVAYQAREQLARAHDFIKLEGLQIDAKETLLLVHTGGNDLLHALRDPRLLFLIIRDLARFSPTNKEHSLSFAVEISIVISQQLSGVLADAASYGHQKVLLSTPPLSSAIPLVRGLVQLIAPTQSMSTLSEALTAMSAVLNREIISAVRATAAQHSLELTVFEEGAHLTNLASLAEADSLGLVDVPGLIVHMWMRRRQGLLAHYTGFWQDGHHPSVQVHHELARRVIAQLVNESAPS